MLGIGIQVSYVDKSVENPFDYSNFKHESIRRKRSGMTY